MLRSARPAAGKTHSRSAANATLGPAPATRAGGGHEVHRDFVDFVVDGSPLPFRLPGPDAVPPLASDVPPAIFTTQVRRRAAGSC